MTRSELEAVWTGELVLMTRRASLTDLSRRFDFSWFLDCRRRDPKPDRRRAGRVS
jgi:ATP-binding cassette, subfamily B, bacterial HlyB/CyaB